MKTYRQLIKENFFDSDSLADEAILLAKSNYPTEYKKRDINALIAKLKSDLTKQATTELNDELPDVLARVKKEISTYWRQEDKK